MKLYVVENRTSKTMLDVAEKRTGLVENMTGRIRLQVVENVWVK